MITVKINNAELEAAFEDIQSYGNEVRKKIKDIKNATGLRVETGAKKRVPVDTGRLKTSIRHISINDLRSEVGTNVEYAGNVEFGINQRPQPYLFPAAEEQKYRYINEIKNALKDT